MKIILDSNISKKFPDFKVKAFSVQNNSLSNSFELTENRKKYLINNYDKSLSSAKLMSDFYRSNNVKRKCHIETLLEAYRKKSRFKSISYLVDLVYYLELATGLLMGIHDSKYLSEYINVFSTEGVESFKHISGKIIELPNGTIGMRDAKKTFASLTEGPDEDTKVTNSTEDAVVVIFFPTNVDTGDKMQVVENTLLEEGLQEIIYLEEEIN